MQQQQAMHSLAEAVGGSSWIMLDAEELNLHSLIVQTLELDTTIVVTVMMQVLGV